MKINLDIKKTYRTIEINGKRIQIPKLGLKHHAIASKHADDLEEGFKQIINSIASNMSKAERDYVTLHLLAYNEKISEKTVIDGHEYSIFDVKIAQQLKFYIGDTEYKFKTPVLDDKPTVDAVLTNNCVSVKKDGVPQPIPDFLKMPAFVHSWVEKITDTISLETPHGNINGLYKLIGTFNGR